MKSLRWILFSTILVTGIASAQTKQGPAIPRSSFLAQLNPAFRTDDGKGLNIQAIAKAYAAADTDVRADDFESYHEKFRLTPEAQQEFDAVVGRRFERLFLPKFQNESWHRLNTSCEVIDGRQHLGSLLFRYTLGDGLPDFVFSGAWVPAENVNSRSLADVMSVMKGAAVPGTGYRIQVLENDFGIYTNLRAPLSVTYRRYKGNLIGEFRSDAGRFMGYKVCFSRSEAACSIRVAAKIRYDDPSMTEQKIINLVQVSDDAKDLSKIRENLLAEVARELGCWQNGGGISSRDSCAAFEKAKKDMQCGTDLSRIRFYGFDKKLNKWLTATSR